MAITINGNGTVSGITSGAGKVLQIQRLNYSAPYASGNMSSWTDMSGWSCDITTLGSNSKILFQVAFGIVHSEHNAISFQVYRDNTQIGLGNANGVRDRASFRTTKYGFDGNHGVNACWQYLDELTASAGTTHTYKLKGRNEGTNNFYINRTANYGNNTYNYDGTFHSTIILTEIAP